MYESACVFVCKYKCVYVYNCICMCIVCEHVYVSLCECISIYVYVLCVYVCMGLCECVYKCVCMCFFCILQSGYCVLCTGYSSLVLCTGYCIPQSGCCVLDTGYPIWVLGTVYCISQSLSGLLAHLSPWRYLPIRTKLPWLKPSPTLHLQGRLQLTAALPNGVVVMDAV